MAKLKSFKKQAESLANSLFEPGKRSRGIRSNINYAEALTRIGRWCHDTYSINRLDNITFDMVEQYMEERRYTVKRSTLDQERQALRLLTEREQSRLFQTEIPVYKSEVEQTLTSRRYTDWQIGIIKENQSYTNWIATEIAAITGIRAHELLTIRRYDERPPSKRNWNPNLYVGKSHWHRYTVIGKGGLCREIRIPDKISSLLESRRRQTPAKVNDRGIAYKTYYDIGGGKNWSMSVTTLSKKYLGWSNGAHGFRHSYVQNRVREIQLLGFRHKDAKAIVSQEIGHHRPGIINAYLR